MIDIEQVSQMAADIAKANLGPGNVIRVESEPSTDLDGNDAWRVTIVIPPGVAEKLNGDAVLDTLVQIQHRLQEIGDDRFAFVHYATEAELESVGDS
jgi:hypothetical protein